MALPTDYGDEADALTRMRELQAYSVSLESPDAYFRDGDGKLTRPETLRFFVAIERDLLGLDAEAWAALKKEAFPLLTAKVPGRGWEQLFSILNQSRAYNYLKTRGCKEIAFIPRAKRKTPDLRAKLAGRSVLCEVKTIHISQNEVDRRSSGGVGTTLAHVTLEFLSKLHSDIDVATAQMAEFNSNPETLRIVYVVINFDDSLHEYAGDYENQIRTNLAVNRAAGVDVQLDIKPRFYYVI